MPSAVGPYGLELKFYFIIALLSKYSEMDNLY